MLRQLTDFFKSNNTGSRFIKTEQDALETIKAIFAKNTPVYIFDGTPAGHILLKDDRFHDMLHEFLKGGGQAGIVIPDRFTEQQARIKDTTRRHRENGEMTLLLAGRNNFENMNHTIRKTLSRYYSPPIEHIFVIATQNAYLIERNIYGNVTKANLHDAEGGKSNALAQVMSRFIETQRISPLIFPQADIRP
jgi:hypothetical protein